MFALSLNFKTADVSLRESFAFDEEKTLSLLSILKANNIKECVYLSTCNRCEIYGVGDVYSALKNFSSFAKIPDEPPEKLVFLSLSLSIIVLLHFSPKIHRKIFRCCFH